MSLDKCRTCNGACCKVFTLNYSKKELFMGIFGKGRLAKLDVTIFEFIKQLICLRSIQKQVSKQREVYPWENYYTCRALHKNRCLIYRFRMVFCPKYECHGVKQLANQISVDGKPPLPIAHPIYPCKGGELKEAA